MFEATLQDTSGSSSGMLCSLALVPEPLPLMYGLGHVHWRMQFNNYVQSNGLQRSFYWGAPQQTGPTLAPTWTISVFSKSTLPRTVPIDGAD